MGPYYVGRTTIVQVNDGALQLFPPLGGLLLGSDRNAVFHAVAFLFRNKRNEEKKNMSSFRKKKPRVAMFF